MSVSPDVLRTHLAYTEWASLLLVESAAQLTPDQLNQDFQTSDHSILGTLVHIYAADRVWLARLRGDAAQPFLTADDHHLSVLQNDWPALFQRWHEWAAGITDQAALTNISYHDIKGRPWTQPLWQLILHVVNHGTHHRGQVSGFLRSLGHTPPPLDLVAYYRQIARAQSQTI